MRGPMNSYVRGVVALLAAMAPARLLIASEQTPPMAVVPIEIQPSVREAWAALKAADSKIAELITQGQLADVAAQSRVVRVSVETILRGVRPTDESVLKRLVSAGREIIALSDHLTSVAATGNRARTDVVHANLHKYVDFVQKRLPLLEDAPNRENPRS